MKWSALFALVLFQDDHDSSSVKAVLPTAESIQKREYALAKEHQEKIHMATGIKPSETKIVYHSAEAQLQYPEEGKFKTRTIVTKAEGIKGPIRLAVSILPEDHRIVGVRVLEQQEGMELNDSAFLEQFSGLAYSIASLWRPQSDLVDRQRRAAKPASDEDRIIDLLLFNKSLMNKVGELFSSAGSRVRANDAEAVKNLNGLQQGYEGLAEKIKAATFLDDAKRQKLATLVSDTRERFKTVSDLVQANKFSDAQDKFAEIGRKSCGACHGSFQGGFRKKREELGLGDGYFSIDFELKLSPDLDRKIQESIARSVRRSVMMLELAPE